MPKEVKDSRKGYDSTTYTSTGETEVADIRVKADGSTATTAGNAVREQISELNQALDNYAGGCVVTESGNPVTVKADEVSNKAKAPVLNGETTQAATTLRRWRWTRRCMMWIVWIL